jgi:hypothetical protein
MSVVEYEITYPNSPRFVFHNSCGIEAGAESDYHGMEARDGHESMQLRVDTKVRQTRRQRADTPWRSVSCKLVTVVSIWKLL